MPLTYTIDKAARLATILYDISPEFAEFQRTIRAVFDDHDYESGFKFLFDRHLVEEPPTTEYVRSAVRLIRGNEQKFSFIVSVVRNDASYGMARMGHILAEDISVSIQIFKDIEEAKRWLQSC